jgi:FkbM family methyltransferase
MHYDFIEIGTSDFSTILQEKNIGIGLSIEPLLIYLNNLPDKETVIKVNCAVSDKDGYADVYWIDPEDIKKYNLPDWLRGCNSIINPHPTAVAELNVRNLYSIYKKDICEIISWDTLVKRYNVNSVDYLKIDTEGHDYIILENMLSSEMNILPKKIVFENNILTSQEATNRILNKLIEKGYIVTNRTPDDISVEKVEIK